MISSTESLPVEFEFRELGCISYQEAWDLQRELQGCLIRRLAENPDITPSPVVLLCQHQPAITLGKSTKANSLRQDRSSLVKRGVDVFEIERGGDATFHGPGQLVAYPVLYLGWFRKDVHWYMRQLEEAVIKTLENFHIPAFRQPGLTGVWTTRGDESPPQTQIKIAALGVRISRWCTMHGIALNVSNECLSGFELIQPCGLSDIKISSMESELAFKNDPAPSMEEVTERFKLNFAQVFAAARSRSGE